MIDGINPSTAFKSKLMDPRKLIQDDYWNLVTHARDKRDGPNGIAIWNAVDK